MDLSTLAGPLSSAWSNGWSLALLEDAPASSSGFGSMLVPILLMFGIFYFVLILPERKKQKQRTAMLAAIKKGDRVMTTSGILAKVVSVSEEEVRLEIADGVRVLFSRQAIQVVVDPAAKGKEKQAGKDGQAKGEESEATSPA